MAVLEGDMTTQLDAQRLEAVGVPVVPITTGRACHLDASMVSGGLKLLQQRLDPASLDLLWVENVGNLVCPAEFEVGEHLKVALLSVTEGDDKPLKYPVMFREADCVLITKIDLLPYLSVQVERFVEHVQHVNPGPRCSCSPPAVARALRRGTSGSWSRCRNASPPRNQPLIQQPKRSTTSPSPPW